MTTFASIADRNAIEAEMPWEERELPATLYSFLTAARDSHGRRPAVSFQLLSDPGAPAETLTWDQLHGKIGTLQRGAVYPLDCQFAQRRFEHFADSSLWQLVDNFDMSWNRRTLMNPVSCEFHQRLGVRRRTINQLHIRARQFAGMNIRLTNRAHESHIWVRG